MNTRVSLFDRTEYVNLGPNQECQICQKGDWCQTLVDRVSGVVEASLCRREHLWTRSPDIMIDGAGIFLNQTRQPVERSKRFQPQVQTKSQRPQAKAKTADRIYSQILSFLGLQAKHQQQLKQRGLSIDQIQQLGYGSLPETHPQRIELMQALKNEQSHLLTVGGFYLSKNGHTWISQQEGMMIPCRNVEGQIVGAQIRSDRNQGSRYKWLSASSSQRKRGGVSSGSPIHVAKNAGDQSTVWITEGLLKADIASLKLEQTVIGLAGVNSYQKDELIQTLRQLGAKQVVIALDADHQTNPAVRQAINRLAQLLMAHHLKCQLASWPIEEGKGIDDLLVKNGQYQLQPMSASLELNKVPATPIAEEKEGVISWQKTKRVRIAPVKIEIQTPDLSLSQVRQQIAEETNHYLDQFEGDGQTLMLRATQGVGKTTISLKTVLEKPDYRIILASPRHQLLQEAIERHQLDSWTHIRPRRPSSGKYLSLSVAEGLEYLQWMKEESQRNQAPIHTNQYKILCHRQREANQLAIKNWSVIQNLCSSKCEIGLKGNCAYFRQYQMPGSIATVHETLFIDRLCQNIFRDRITNPKQVVVMDEPDPNKFVRSTDISTKDLTYSIANVWSAELKLLLQVVREAIEGKQKFLQQQKRRQLIGREVMEAIAREAENKGQDLGQLLEAVEAERPSQHQQVVVSIDAFIGVTKRAYQVLIGNEELYIPQSASSPIDNGRIWVEANLAKQKGWPISSEFDSREEEIPLNYQSNLLRTLNREYQLYIQDQGYNSALVMTTSGLKLNIRQHCQVPSDVPMVLLDGQGNAKLMSQLLGREVKLWSAPVSAQVQISQMVDGVYGLTSLWDSQNQKPKPTLVKLMQKVILPACQYQPENLLIVTWKKVADYLRDLQTKGQIPAEVGIEHYGNLKGSNQHQDRQRCILLGTPSTSSVSVEEMANALYVEAEDPISMETEWVWKNYNYQDYQGQQYQAQVRQYVDPRVEQVARLFREDEMVQAAHRIRGVNHQDREILIISQLPIEELKPTCLTTLKDYAQNQGQKIDAIESGLDWLLEDQGYFNAKQLKSLLSETNVNLAIKNNINSQTDERESQYRFVSDSTLERRVKKQAEILGLRRSRVTVEVRDAERGGGATHCYVYHQDPLTAEQVEEIKAWYQLLALADDPLLRPDQVAVSLEPEMVAVESPFEPPSGIRWDEDVGFG